MLLIALYFLLGCFSGTAFGMLGVGGGIVTIPGLLWIFSRLGFSPAILMQLSAGTSLGVIVISSLSATSVHFRRMPEVWSIYLKVMPGVVLGALTGAFLASRMDSRHLSFLFAFLVIFAALRMLFSEAKSKKTIAMPSNAILAVFGIVVGTISTLLGIGGGLLIVPFFSYVGVDIRKAMVISTLISLTVSVIGAISFIWHGWHHPGLPKHSLGFVYLPALLAVAMGSMLCTPLGVWINKSVSSRLLHRIFAIFLCLVGIKMLF